MATAREIRLWNRQRDTTRTNCTAEINKSLAYLIPDAEVTTAQLQASITVLRTFQEKLSKFDTDILLQIDDDDEALNEAEHAAAFEYNLLQHISNLSANLEIQLSTNVVGNVSTAVTERSTSPHGSVSQSVNLPKIQIRKFGGDPQKWAEFWDNFASTIHENEELPDVEKFKYLQSYLEGDALGVIAGYRMTNANYAHVVDELKERYGNEQLAVFGHFQSIIELSAASNDTPQLQKVYDECEKHIRSLVALGRNEDTFGEVFTPLILSKLPSDVKMELYRRNRSRPWDLANLRELLKEEIRARDYSQRTFGGTSTTVTQNSSRNSKQGFQRHQHHGTSASLVTHDNTTPSLNCIFCDESHFSDKCQKFPDVDSRRGCLAGRCYICFSTQHSVKNCPSQKTCVHCGKRDHNRSLCYSKFSSSGSLANRENSLQISDNSSNCDSPPTEHSSALLSHGETTILQTALCSIQGEKSVSTARMLFDTACSRTFITRDICDRIGARHLGKNTVSIAGFTSKKRTTKEYDSVEFDVVLRDGEKKTLVTNVIDHITAPVQKIPLDRDSKLGLATMKLAEPLISSPQLVPIDILLGADYYYEFIGPHRIHMRGGLILLPSSLGLVATGRVSNSFGAGNSHTSLNVSVDPITSVDVEKFWSLEDIGVKSPTNTDDDQESMNTFNRTVKFENSRYQVQLPYKVDAKELPENKNLAYACLVSQLKRLKSDGEILKKYDTIIKDQLSKGIIEVAPKVPTGEKVHYLPHHCVVTPNKATTKVRVVYNASAKAGKSTPSLNDCLNRGPVILDDLCGLLIKFRLHAIGLVSDIEKAFLQVGLQECDRDVTRFFWVKDISEPHTGDNLVILRFCRVLFGAISSPFLLGATVQHHMNNSKRNVANDVKGHGYVDNVINGKDTVETAVDFYNEAKKLFNEASMNLREWFTNSKSVQNHIAIADRGDSVCTKVLGLKWDTDADTLSCGSFVVQEDSINTKRLMLKYLAKVFDPCGYFSAVTVTGKLLIQKLWQLKLDWDDIVPADIIAEWKKCCDSLQQIESHKIRRCYNSDIGKDGVEYSLHCFCDASGKAYAAVVYLVVSAPSGISSNIVFAKTRVAPIKPLTIPRLELMAVVVGVRIMSFVKSALGLPIEKQYVWSDSKCVLHWLSKSSIDTVFVRNRVQEINSHKDIQFRLWWHGPVWIVQEDNKWPENIKVTIELEQHVEENSYDIAHVVSHCNQESITSIDRFSSLSRLLRVTAWMKRFIHNCRNKDKVSGHLTASELINARYYWDTWTQNVSFGNLLSAKDNKSRNVVRQLDLFIDNQGLIRCGGRLKEANIGYQARHPILLSKNNRYTDLMIADCHIRLFHAGVAHTLAQLRQQYWVVHGRNQVRRVINCCYICKLAHRGPYRYPDPPPLPNFRVTQQKPFETVGVDYMGPLFVKDTSSGNVSKVWICLFTCSVTRAIHLEIVDNLTADQFLLCLKRFIACYGNPNLIVSDNAKHFHSVNQHLTRVWREIRQSREVQDWSSHQGIEWKFIVELSPWMGGFYERMVGIVKKTLKKLLDTRCVSKTELHTVVVESSAVINSRPLVYVDNDITEVTLTPAHFLGGPHSLLPNSEIDSDNYQTPPNKTTDLVELWNRNNNILASFWQQWQNQYLLSLRERGYHVKQKNAFVTNPSVGDVVIVKDNLLRKHWRIARINELFTSSDGKIRSASVQLPNKKSINRPIRLLFPLETNCPYAKRETRTPKEPVNKRSKRQAFVEATRKIQQSSVDNISDDDEIEDE